MAVLSRAVAGSALGRRFEARFSSCISPRLRQSAAAPLLPLPGGGGAPPEAGGGGAAPPSAASCDTVMLQRLASTSLWPAASSMRAAEALGLKL